MSENLNTAEETIESDVMCRPDECRESALYGNTDQMRRRREDLVRVMVDIKGRRARERMTSYIMELYVCSFIACVSLALLVAFVYKDSEWYALAFAGIVLALSLGGIHISIKSYLRERNFLVE